MERTSLMRIDEAPNVFTDAVLTDNGGRLLFLSLWGRDTALHEFIARLSLPTSQNGCDRFRVIGGDKTVAVWVPNVETLTKESGRMPPNLFGELTHVWLFDVLAQAPDRVNRRALLFMRRQSDVADGSRIWSAVRDLCPVPLLDHWRDTVLPMFERLGWIRTVHGINVSAVEIQLGDDELERLVSEAVQQSRLMLDPIEIGHACGD